MMTISGPDEVLFGQSKIYKLTVSNPGNGDTENVTVGLAADRPRHAKGPTSHRLGTLRAGESKSIDIELTARQAGAIDDQGPGLRRWRAAHRGRRASARAPRQPAQSRSRPRASNTPAPSAPITSRWSTPATPRPKTCRSRPCCRPTPSTFPAAAADGFEAQQGKVNWIVGTLQPGGQRVFEMQCSLAAPGENRMQFVAAGRRRSEHRGHLDHARRGPGRSETRSSRPAGSDRRGRRRRLRSPHSQSRHQGRRTHRPGRVLLRGPRSRRVPTGEPHEISTGPGGLQAASPSSGPARRPCFESTLGPTAAAITSSGPRWSASRLQTKLAAEETTHFYGDDRADASAAATQTGATMPRRNRGCRPSANR